MPRIFQDHQPWSSSLSFSAFADPFPGRSVDHGLNHIPCRSLGCHQHDCLRVHGQAPTTNGWFYKRITSTVPCRISFLGSWFFSWAARMMLEHWLRVKQINYIDRTCTGKFCYASKHTLGETVLSIFYIFQPCFLLEKEIIQV